MYTRKQVRYSIARCREDGEHPSHHQEVYDYVLSILPEGYDIWDFPEEWDVIVSKKGVFFVEPERDISYVQSTCAEAKVLHKHGLPFDELSDRQLNIVRIIETSMLEGIMDWSNYGENWRVTLDEFNGSIGTQLLKVPAGQKPVTEKMIQDSQQIDPEKLSDEAKRRIADKEAGITYDKTINLTGDNQWQQMTPAEIDALRKLSGKE